jgi:hypothetical protein
MNTAYTISLNWFAKSYATKAALLTAKRVHIDQTAIILLASLSYNGIQEISWLGIVIVIEALSISRYMRWLPYHMLMMNKLYIGLFLVEIWVTVILCISKIANYTDQSDLFGISMLILVTPNFYIVTDHFINAKWDNIMKQETFYNLL